MAVEKNSEVAEIRMSYRYVKDHPWVVQAVNGFLSAYFMEYPGFRVQRHFDELESGMHVWVCEIPPEMKVPRLLRRLADDIPPFRYKQTDADPQAPPRYVIECIDPDSNDPAQVGRQS